MFLEELVRTPGQGARQGQLGEQKMFDTKYIAAMAFTAALGANAASAADLSRPYYKAPPAYVDSIYNWSGFYVGAHLGGAWTNRKYHRLR
jgi:opacity protein-like surface antigen